MSHPLGPLTGILTALAVFEYGQMAMHAALEAVAAGNYATAACELEAAADAAVTLSQQLVDTAPDRSRRWLACADHREQWAYEAWSAAETDDHVHLNA